METNIIYNEDCLEGMKKLPDNSIDLTITSPPYDDLRKYEGFSWDFYKIADELYRITKEGGVVVWIVADQTKNGSETLSSFRQALFFVDEVDFKMHDTMIYKTNKLPISANRYEPCFEYMFVLSKGKPKTFNPLKEKSKYAGDSTLAKTFRHTGEETGKLHSGNKVKKYKVKNNIWFYPTGHNKTTKDKFAFNHPAMFPENLAKDHIKSWSNKGDIILDPFMGSGTTAKMAQLLERKWIGFELSKKYIDIAYKRLGKLNKKYYEELPDDKKPAQLQMF